MKRTVIERRERARSLSSIWPTKRLTQINGDFENFCTKLGSLFHCSREREQDFSVTARNSLNVITALAESIRSQLKIASVIGYRTGRGSLILNDLFIVSYLIQRSISLYLQRKMGWLTPEDN